MNQTRLSLFALSIRAFFVTICVFLGIGVGIILLALMFVSHDHIEQKTEVRVVADAEGERNSLSYSGPVILQLNIDGVIGLQKLTSARVRNVLVESREGILAGNRVKAILLYIDSPGGTASDSMNIYEMLQEYKKRHDVPIVAYVEGVGASGAMMIAAAADHVVASDSSIVGSVGVVTSSFFNVSEVLKQYNVEALTLTAGKGKDTLNPFRKWSKDEASSIQTIVDYQYDLFVNLMTTNRPRLNKEKLLQDYGAKIFPANLGAEYGFIDEAGYSLSEAIQLAVKAADLEGKEYNVVQLEQRLWTSDLFQETMPLLRGKVVHQLQLSPEIPAELMNKHLFMYVPGAA
jgi:signal peptide peptidase SppA